MKMREDLFASILRQDVAFYDNHKSGEIMSRLTTDIQEFKSSFKQVCQYRCTYFVNYATSKIYQVLYTSTQFNNVQIIGHINGVAFNGTNDWKYDFIVYDIS